MAKAKPAATSQILNPRTTTYEFLGPLGAFFIIVGVPVTLYAVHFGCSSAYDCRPSLSGVRLSTVMKAEWWKSLWDTEATILYLCWYAFTIICWAILPGKLIEGKTMRNGAKKKYKINGEFSYCLPARIYTCILKIYSLAFATFLTAVGIVGGTILWKGEGFLARWIYDKWLGLLTAATIMAIIQSVYVYLASFIGNKLLALGGNSGNIIYDVRVPADDLHLT